jgi:Calcium-dependent channel, 7TM region, putative phosphate
MVLNVVYLFDIPHFLVRTFRWYLYKYKHRRDPPEVLQRFKDTWSFDLGYFQAYSLTMFFLGFLFAVVIPLITIFATFLFLVRFQFDKYNQTFVYFKKFEAKGRLKKHIVYCMIGIIMVS